MFFDMLSALCKQNKTTPNAVAKACGLSNSTSTKWKKGATPESATLKKIGGYFGVSIEFLMGATPEAYLLWTEYKLNEAEKAYDKESDPTKRDELGAEIDALRDSLEDQQIALALTQKKPDTSNGVGTQGNGIIGGLANSFDGPEDADIAQEEWLLRVARTLPAEDRNRLADYAHILATSRGLPVEEPPTGD